MLKNPSEISDPAKAKTRGKRIARIKDAISLAHSNRKPYQKANAILKRTGTRATGFDRSGTYQGPVRFLKAKSRKIGEMLEMLTSPKEFMLQGKDMRGSARSQRLDNVKKAGIRNGNIAKAMAKTGANNDLALHKKHKADNILSRANDRDHFQARKAYKQNWVASNPWHKQMKANLK